MQGAQNDHFQRKNERKSSSQLELQRISNNQNENNQRNESPAFGTPEYQQYLKNPLEQSFSDNANTAYQSDEEKNGSLGDKVKKLQLQQQNFHSKKDNDIKLKLILQQIQYSVGKVLSTLNYKITQRKIVSFKQIQIFTEQERFKNRNQAIQVMNQIQQQLNRLSSIVEKHRKLKMLKSFSQIQFFCHQKYEEQKQSIQQSSVITQCKDYQNKINELQKELDQYEHRINVNANPQQDCQQQNIKLKQQVAQNQQEINCFIKEMNQLLEFHQLSCQNQVEQENNDFIAEIISMQEKSNPSYTQSTKSTISKKYFSNDKLSKAIQKFKQ